MNSGTICPLVYHSETKEGYEVTCSKVIYNVSDNSLTQIGISSPLDFVGQGRTYGQALEDYIKQFEKYLNELNNFYTDVLLTQRSYTEAVDVDYNWHPVKCQSEMLMQMFKEQYKKEYGNE